MKCVLKCILASLALLTFIACSSAPSEPALDGPEQIKEQTPEQKEIAVHLAAKKDDFRACYEMHEGELPANAGRTLLAHFFINGNGLVNSVTFEADTLSSPPIESCLMAVIKTIHFDPRPEATPLEIHYPFKFKKRSN